jgi:ribonuclease inhibitor
MSHLYTLQGSHIQDVETFYREVSKVFAFPDYFGNNLDALYDCLSEYEGETVVWTEFDAIEEKLGPSLPAIMEVFSSAGIEVVLEYGF